MMEGTMKFYHGTDNRNIERFVMFNKSPKKDFGKGVYLTTNIEQAKEWSCKYSVTGAVYEFDINLENLKQLDLSNVEDLYYVIYLCRINLEDIAKETIDNFDNADIVSGFMLDGSIGDFEKIAELFNEGELSYDEFYSKINMFDKDKNQICVKTEQGLAEINAGIVKKYYTKIEKKSNERKKIIIDGEVNLMNT